MASAGLPCREEVAMLQGRVGRGRQAGALEAGSIRLLCLPTQARVARLAEWFNLSIFACVIEAAGASDVA